ncbi:cholesterol 7-desaturase nvd-like [Choristoneura fumiferana]|uniref:cholesterol 7-desaturase nvd-like n=1 Tax=Choristoneura fumiferana TaxID=7141 RepID=UPI003D15534E
MLSVDGQCSTSEALPAKMKSPAISNCQIDNDVLLFYFKLALAALRTALECIYAHKLGLMLSVILVLFVYVIYKSYWSPILYLKELPDVGFNHIPKGANRDMKVARALQTRQVGTKLPPPYPNGWFALAESRDLKIGGVVSVDALGHNFAVYRGEDGVARCVDAYCPHLGANMGVGGTVRGSCIECPFHKWTFNAEGTCVSIPDLDSPPKGISIKTWPTAEGDGAVWVWYDAEGRSPLWSVLSPEEQEEMQGWGYRGRNEFVVSTHIMDIPENGADIAHLSPVHSTSVFTSVANKHPYLLNFVGHHSWEAEWTRREEHRARMTLTHYYKFGKLSIFRLNAIADQNGPGHVRLRFQTRFGPVLFSLSVTPIGVLRQKVVHRVFSPWYNAVMAASFIPMESYMFERDITMWNNKRYISSPIYVKTDKSIRAFRAWYSQFYSEKSVSFKDATQNPLDW